MSATVEDAIRKFKAATGRAPTRAELLERAGYSNMQSLEAMLRRLRAAGKVRVGKAPMRRIDLVQS